MNTRDKTRRFFHALGAGVSFGFQLLVVSALCLLILALAGWLSLYLSGYGDPRALLTNPPSPTQKADLKTAAPFLAVGASVATMFATLFLGLRQTEAARTLERLKAVLGKNVQAREDLFAAVTRYQRALKPLETGGYFAELADAAEVAMQTCEGKLIYVDAQVDEQWQSFWQKARMTKERAQRIAGDKDALKKLWNEDGAAARISEGVEALKTAFRSELG